MRSWAVHLWKILADHREAEVFCAVDEAGASSTTSYKEWLREITRAAIGLLDQGFAAGSRVGFVTPNTRESLTLMLATWLAGGCVVPLVPTRERRDTLRGLARSGCDWIVLRDAEHLAELRDPRLPPHLRWLALRADGVVVDEQVLTWDHLMERGKYREIRGGDKTLKERAFNHAASEPAVILYDPEAEEVAHGAFYSGEKLAAMLQHLGADLQLDESDRVGVLLSMGWFHAALVTWATITQGRALVMAPTLGAMIKNLGALRPSHIVCGPAFLQGQARKWQQRLSEAPEFLQRMAEQPGEQASGFSFKRALSGIGERAAKRAMYEPIREDLGGALRAIYVVDGVLPQDVYEILGEMEIGVLGVFGVPEVGVSHLERIGAQRANSVGRPVQGYACKIDSAREGEVGEVLLRAPVMFDGYWDGEGPRALDAEGWLHTGRRGHISGGFLSLEQA